MVVSISVLKTSLESIMNVMNAWNSCFADVKYTCISISRSTCFSLVDTACIMTNFAVGTSCMWSTIEYSFYYFGRIILELTFVFYAGQMFTKYWVCIPTAPHWNLFHQSFEMLYGFAHLTWKFSCLMLVSFSFSSKVIYIF